MNNVEEIFNALNRLGAGEFKHINGTLISHLQGTYSLLKEWDSSNKLCIAGLFHAAYGTSGFDETLVSNDSRSSIMELIGDKAEEIVYTYCSCDRDYFWPQIGLTDTPTFLNRFTREKYELTAEQLNEFCELTVANELEIATDNKEFIVQYYEQLSDLFARMTPFLSKYAIEAINCVFKLPESKNEYETLRTLAAN